MGICFEEEYAFLGELDSCAHAYCFDCISKWAESSNTCPQCKRRFKKLSKIAVATGKKEKTVTIRKKDFSDESANDFSLPANFSSAALGVLSSQLTWGQPEILNLVLGGHPYNDAMQIFHALIPFLGLNQGETDSEEDAEEDHEDESYCECGHCRGPWMWGGFDDDEEEDSDDSDFYGGGGNREGSASNPIEID